MYTGYVISEFPVSAFADICAASNFGKGTILYIFDSENKPVYTTDSSGGISKSLLSNVKSHGKTEINGKEYLPVSSAVANTGWSVVAAVPYNLITASAQTLFNRLVTLSLICCRGHNNHNRRGIVLFHKTHKGASAFHEAVKRRRP